jgi:hypothetical protein
MKKTMKLRIAVANRSALNSFKNSLLSEEDITAGIAEGFDYSLITKTLLTFVIIKDILRFVLAKRNSSSEF